MADQPILSVKGITKRFGGLVALQDIGFAVGRGEAVGLMGPNGAGKTTLLNVISGEYGPDEGAIFFEGQDITNLPPHRLCHLGIARTYQIPQPFITLTPRENLLVSTVFGRQGKRAAPGLAEDRIFDLVNFPGKRDTPAENLPIPSLKKLELARALAQEPKLLLLDEVAAGTTEAEIPRVLSTLQQIRRMGITVLIIEHVMKVMVNAVDRIVVVDKGTKIAEGDPRTVLNDRRVMEAYFGA